MTEKLEIVRGSGNVFRDFNMPDADIRQTKALLAAQIIRILDEEGFSVRKAAKLTGIGYADFSRIRNADLDRFTIDRLMTIVNRLNRRVEVRLRVTPPLVG